MTLGTKLLGEIAATYPTEPPREVLRRKLMAANGNVSRAVRALGTNRQSLLGAIELVGLRPWLDQTYPRRSSGGAPREEVAPELVARIRAGLAGYGLTPLEATVLGKRFDRESWTLDALAADLGMSREGVRKIEQRALKKIADYIKEAAR